MILSAVNLLKDTPKPSEQQIRAGIAGNFCRCTGYQHIVNAIQHAAKKGPPKRKKRSIIICDTPPMSRCPILATVPRVCTVALTSTIVPPLSARNAIAAPLGFCYQSIRRRRDLL
jgi:xanthine dehydrogenase iron-sulfur cluster and FAD-binding subunit A